MYLLSPCRAVTLSVTLWLLKAIDCGKIHLHEVHQRAVEIMLFRGQMLTR